VIGFFGLTALEVPIDRFPPSAVWVICSAGLAYLYYSLASLAHYVQAHAGPAIKSHLSTVGQHVLMYLLLSNLVLFGYVTLGLKSSVNPFQVVAFFALLMLVIVPTHSIRSLRRGLASPSTEQPDEAPPPRPRFGATRSWNDECRSWGGESAKAE